MIIWNHFKVENIDKFKYSLLVLQKMISRRDFLKIAGGVLAGVATKSTSAEASIFAEKEYSTFKEFAVSNYASQNAGITKSGSAGAFFYEREEDDGIVRKEDFSISGLKEDVTIDTVIADASSLFSKQGFKTIGENSGKGTLVMARDSGKIMERYEATIGIYEGVTAGNRRLEFVLTGIKTTYS
ncbi:twin-arginine translocation signal domain-containing protein [Candidatus Woesearchaeota archaeon]|nr:twin-arginine translocation signal domain-containing protein [Candidatus Woesearchaeota archaeon]